MYPRKDTSDVKVKFTLVASRTWTNLDKDQGLGTEIIGELRVVTGIS